MKLMSCVVLFGGLALAPVMANAAPLTGSTITGSLIFKSNPNVNNFSPATAVVGPGVEFSYTDIIGVIDSANFGADGFVIGRYSSLPVSGGAYTMTFTDDAFLGDVLTTNAGINNLGLTYSLAGNTITLSFAGQGLAPGTTSSTFFLTSPAATPEPSSLVLLGTGLAGIVRLSRRRLLRA